MLTCMAFISQKVEHVVRGFYCVTEILLCIFAFQCREEAHRPVDCDTVNKWILKNCAESENMNW